MYSTENNFFFVIKLPKTGSSPKREPNAELLYVQEVVTHLYSKLLRQYTRTQGLGERANGRTQGRWEGVHGRSQGHGEGAHGRPQGRGKGAPHQSLVKGFSNQGRI